MNERPTQSDDSENLNPAKRAAEGIEALADTYGDESESEIEVVDERLRGQVEKRKADAKAEAARQAEVTESAAERIAAPVIETHSERNQARLLLVTRDAGVLTQGSATLRRIGELAGMFAEVHVIFLNVRDEKKSADTRRLADNVWLYSTNSKRWWGTILDARGVAKNQLVVGNGFRPDIIMADEPFEAGVAGYLIARRYKRPFQVHLFHDFLDSTFRTILPHNRWRVLMAKYVLRRVSCVRTQSAYLQNKLIEQFPALQNGSVEVLPIFYDLEGWRASTVTYNLKEQYPQFRFTLLHVSLMNDIAHTDAVIDGLFYILRQYPTVGLVIIGNGPERATLEARVQEYMLGKQIIFESPEVDVLSCMHTADVLIHSSEDVVEDTVVLQAASVGLPIICANRGLASELFIDEESVLLCPVDSPPCFGEKANRLLNENPLRERLAINARTIVSDSIEQDYTAYLAQYRQSIERCATEYIAGLEEQAVS